MAITEKLIDRTSTSLKQYMKALCIVLLIVLSATCTHKNPTANDGALKLKKFHDDLAGKIFLFGPAIDSTKFQIKAHCDCCTSDLALLADSTFIFISNCVDGDTYTKGKFAVIAGNLILKYDSVSVTHAFGFEADTSYELIKTAFKPSLIQISSYNSRLLLVHDFEGSLEYGIIEGPAHYNSVRDRLNNLQIQKSLGHFNLQLLQQNGEEN